ncbi:MAG TPA: chromate transporter [Bacillota bacterium]|nr:chromate transporter [Bacillota bacterium]
MKIKQRLVLFNSFFKIGMLAFGGGYAVAPLLQKETVERRGWITSEELTDIMAVSQTLPGVIMTNSATMIGYRVAGLWGALLATTAAILPTFAITIIVTAFLWQYSDNPWVRKAFTGILIGVGSLIIYSITKLWKTAIRDYFDILLALLSAVGLILFKLNTVLVILGIAFFGFTRNFILSRRGRQVK